MSRVDGKKLKAILAAGILLGGILGCGRLRYDALGACAVDGGCPLVESTLSPLADTFLDVNATVNAASPTLNTYTYPDYRIANAILLQFDLSTVPSGAVLVSASLELHLVDADLDSAAPTYRLTVHEIVHVLPDLALANGYTYDGVNPWTANGCCWNRVPLAQADIGPPASFTDVDEAPGIKTFDVTAIVTDWLLNPAANRGLLVNSDPSLASAHYRYFASLENMMAGASPALRLTYRVP